MPLIWINHTDHIKLLYKEVLQETSHKYVLIKHKRNDIRACTTQWNENLCKGITVPEAAVLHNTQTHKMLILHPEPFGLFLSSHLILCEGNEWVFLLVMMIKSIAQICIERFLWHLRLLYRTVRLYLYIITINFKSQNKLSCRLTNRVIAEISQKTSSVKLRVTNSIWKAETSKRPSMKSSKIFY